MSVVWLVICLLLFLVWLVSSFLNSCVVRWRLSVMLRFWLICFVFILLFLVSVEVLCGWSKIVVWFSGFRYVVGVCVGLVE